MIAYLYNFTGNSSVNGYESSALDSSNEEQDNINENTSTACQINDDDAAIISELPPDLAKRYFLKIREENSLTTTSAKNVMKTTAQLINTIVTNMKRKVVQCLEESNMIADVPSFEDSFADTEEFLQNMITQSMVGDTYEIEEEFVVCLFC